MTADDPLRELFDELEVPTLRRFLDDGADWSGIDDATAYANVTAVRWYGQVPELHHGQDSVEALADFYRDCLFRALRGDDVMIDAETGEATMRTSVGTVPLTEQTLRHWQWLLALLTEEDLAERFLAAVPDAVRAGALQTAGRSYDVA